MIFGMRTPALLLCCGVLFWTGCESPTTPAPAGGGAAVEGTPPGESEPDGGETLAPPQGESASMVGLEGLSEEDKALAIAQKICPVGDSKLGGMGTPVKVEHDGKTYLLCCEHCREPFLKEPEKYIAKLTEKKTE